MTRFDMTTLLLALIMLFWQMAHFFAIGVYRVEDYRVGRLPIYTVVRGEEQTRRQIVLYISLFTIALALLPLTHVVGAIFVLVMLPLTVYWLWGAFQPAKTMIAWGVRMFGVSLSVLLVLCTMFATGSVLP